ncbi:uncharacterized protein A4U43_C08F21010 [Asparagus officinalis]|nr:uncharacterized protein A4U43_C08F21010 [Asparagus officinalis]
MVILGAFFGLLVAFLIICSALLKWNELRYRRKGLPPGTMGWPLFGETTEFLKQGPSFMKNQRARYGNLFKSHILGCPTVMWLFSALKLVAGIESGQFSKAMGSEINKLIIGTLSLPINLPGTSYHQGLQARKKIVSMLERIIEERRASKRTSNDMLDALLFSNDDSRANLDDEQLMDLIITFIYSGFETVSTTSMMAVKYLHQHPKVLKELVKEHVEIRRRKLPDEAIDWNDYKSMTLTRAVIIETSRLATVVNGVLRRTTQDMEIKGYTIPKDWKIYVYIREINYDAFQYPDPFTFDPWRWLGKNQESHPYFMAFGGGTRLCPGKELGIVEIAVFLHYFVTRYRWEEVGGDKLVTFPRVEAPNGLHIRVLER